MMRIMKESSIFRTLRQNDYSDYGNLYDLPSGNKALVSENGMFTVIISGSEDDESMCSVLLYIMDEPNSTMYIHERAFDDEKDAKRFAISLLSKIDIDDMIHKVNDLARDQGMKPIH